MVNFKIYKYKFINLNLIFQIKLTLKGPLYCPTFYSPRRKTSIHTNNTSEKPP